MLLLQQDSKIVSAKCFAPEQIAPSRHPQTSLDQLEIFIKVFTDLFWGQTLSTPPCFCVLLFLGVFLPVLSACWCTLLSSLSSLSAACCSELCCSLLSVCCTFLRFSASRASCQSKPGPRALLGDNGYPKHQPRQSECRGALILNRLDLLMPRFRL